MKTYKLISSQAVMPVIVEYQDEEFHDIRKAIAYVNYGHDQVWFPHNPELETDQMRRAILAGFDHIFPAPAQVPAEIMQQIQQIRSGNFGYEIPDYHQRREE